MRCTQVAGRPRIRIIVFWRRLRDRKRYPTKLSHPETAFANATRDRVCHFRTARVVRVHIWPIRDLALSNALAGVSSIFRFLGRFRPIVSMAERICADYWLPGNPATVAKHGDNRWRICVARKRCRVEQILADRTWFHERSVRLCVDANCGSCCNCYTRSRKINIREIAGRSRITKR